MLLKLISSINRQKYEPSVITLMDLGTIGPKIQSCAIPVYSIGASRGTFSISNFIKLFRLLHFLRPHIVHTWMYHADLLGGLAAKFVGCRNIIWGIRHSDLSFKHNKFSTIFVAKVCAMISRWVPSTIISCSETARQVHECFGYAKNKILVVPNGFAVDSFRPSVANYFSVRKELCLPSRTPLVGLVGRYHPLKNHLGFVQAASIIASVLPSVHFVLVGTDVDEDNSQLNQVIGSAKLESRFHLLGYRPDMPRLMSSFDVLASPSIGEGFSNSIGEAMASGVICVVTNVGDSGFIVGDTGFVVDDLDMSLFAQAVLSVFGLDPTSRQHLSSLTRNRILNLFDLPLVVAQYEGVYDTLTG